jgi:hypothetical protein
MRYVILAAAALILAVPSPAQASVGYDKVVAVVAGVGAYESAGGYSPLPNAKPDAKAFATVLRTRRFSGTTPVVYTLYDGEATEGRIIRTFRKARDEARAARRSLLIFYFAGHGRRGSGGQGYLVPFGATDESEYISMSALQDLAGPDNGVQHQLFILGSCFSGTFVTRSDTPRAEELERSEDASRWLAAQLDRRVRAAILAGGDDEKMPDGAPGDLSLFGRAVVDALSQRPGAAGGLSTADQDRDG